VAGFRVTVRLGPKVTRSEHETLDEALAAMRRAIDGIDARRDPVQWIRREIPPERQVAARVEVAGPRGVRGGVDLRGDGSSEAFTGRLRRVLVEQQRGEDAVAALGRVLTG
jgi:hypothetical protein